MSCQPKNFNDYTNHIWEQVEKTDERLGLLFLKFAFVGTVFDDYVG